MTDVTFSVARGEVVALLGENGAGKSTLKNIVLGLTNPDAGTLSFGGVSYDRLSPSVASDLGIAAIHQELSLFENLSVAENVGIGRYPTRAGMVDYRALNLQARELLHDRLGTTLDPRLAVADLSIGERQIVEVAKALNRAGSLVIFDEPTTSLSITERESLFQVVRLLRDSGYAVLYVTHFLEEVFALADRVVVIRGGVVVTEDQISAYTEPLLVSHMVGRELLAVDAELPPALEPHARTVLDVADMSDGTRVRGVSASVRAGEIVGVAGLMGSGRTELAEAIIGLRAASGDVTLDGTPFVRRDPLRALHRGLVLVSEDRRNEQAFLGRPISENVLPVLAGDAGVRAQRWGFIARRRLALAVQGLLATFRVRAGSASKPMVSLSGGNQQKVVLARWLRGTPRACILDEPTKGIDVGAKAEVHKLVFGLARDGAAVMLISSDLPELVALSHRILVMHKGELVGELARDQFSREAIIRLASVGASK